jgi:hypothetical protein
VKLDNVGNAVVNTDGEVILPGGTTTIRAWGRGSRYTDESGTGQFITGDLPVFEKSANLLDGAGKFFEKSRPQYETLSVNDFVSVQGKTSLDSISIQNVTSLAPDRLLNYFYQDFTQSLSQNLCIVHAI